MNTASAVADVLATFLSLVKVGPSMEPVLGVTMKTTYYVPFLQRKKMSIPYIFDNSLTVNEHFSFIFLYRNDMQCYFTVYNFLTDVMFIRGDVLG